MIQNRGRGVDRADRIITSLATLATLFCVAAVVISAAHGDWVDVCIYAVAGAATAVVSLWDRIFRTR